MVMKGKAFGGWETRSSYANVRLLGAMLNKRTFPIPEALYRKI